MLQEKDFQLFWSKISLNFAWFSDVIFLKIGKNPDTVVTSGRTFLVWWGVRVASRTSQACFWTQTTENERYLQACWVTILQSPDTHIRIHTSPDQSLTTYQVADNQADPSVQGDLSEFHPFTSSVFSRSHQRFALETITLSVLKSWHLCFVPALPEVNMTLFCGVCNCVAKPDSCNFSAQRSR